MSFWKNRPLIVAIVVFIILGVLLFATSGHNSQNESDTLFGGMISGMQEGVYKSTVSVRNFFSHLFMASDADKENQELTEKVAYLQKQLQDYESVIKENERLKELLNVKDTVSDYDILTAQIIGKNSGSWFSEFTVNSGSLDGIKKDMIVMTNDGLLGKVSSTNETYCKIISLINKNIGVPAMTERSRDYGVIKSANETKDKESGLLSFEYISQNADIIPGDEIITSGMGGSYPKGIPIGKVTEVSKDSNSMYVTVKSDIDYEHLEEVVIILEEFEEKK